MYIQLAYSVAGERYILELHFVHIDWFDFQQIGFHEAFLRKSKQIGVSGADFCAEYEYVVCVSQICLIRSLIKVKGQLVQNSYFYKICFILHPKYRYANYLSISFILNHTNIVKV